jgi:hypothetical protein
MKKFLKVTFVASIVCASYFSMNFSQNQLAERKLFAAAEMQCVACEPRSASYCRMDECTTYSWWPGWLCLGHVGC